MNIYVFFVRVQLTMLQLSILSQTPNKQVRILIIHSYKGLIKKWFHYTYIFS